MGYRDEQCAWKRRRIWQHCDMWTQSEIAAELGLSRRTVYNYIRELYDEGRLAKMGIYYIRVEGERHA